MARGAKNALDNIKKINIPQIKRGFIPDDAFVHVTPSKWGNKIASEGFNTEKTPFVTKWKYVKDIENDPTIFNTKLYKQSLWPQTASKFDDGATILKIDMPANVKPTYFSPFTNNVNGIPQWKLPIGKYEAQIITQFFSENDLKRAA